MNNLTQKQFHPYWGFSSPIQKLEIKSLLGRGKLKLEYGVIVFDCKNTFVF